ncbi:MAG: hypothetical protein QM734_02755 [Cyclobacteriaceae bacterium]
MLIPFHQLPAHSRIWIYQTNRSISSTEKKIISSVLSEFCSEWSAHGNPLTTSFKIELGHFIILSVDENTAGASGCSIDGSVRVLKELGQQLNIDFFDRTNIAFLLEGEIRLFPMKELPMLFKTGTLTSSSVTFNNLVPNKSSFEKDWKVSTENSWLAKYLTKTTLSA